MSSLEETVISKLVSNNLKACYIVINSQYLMHNGKKVLCEVTKHETTELSFFVRNGKSEGQYESRTFLSNEYEVLKERVFSDTLFGQRLPIVVSPDTYSVKVVPSLSLIVIESQLYQVARDIAEKQIEKQQKGETFNFNTISLSSVSDISALEYGRFMDNFWRASRITYRDLIYGNSSWFVRRAYRLHDFYKLLDAFIPVFIDCNLFFNPMKDIAAVNTDMYRTAVRCGRVVSDGNDSFSFTAYFMSQTEVCKAFNMRHFMRFTPNLWYDIFMGLVYTNDAAFPSVSRKVMQGPNGVSAYGISRTMSIQDFKAKVETANKALRFSAPVQFGGVSTNPEEFLKMLSAYHEVDSLWLECSSAINAITRSGAHVLDDKERATVENVYQIMLEAHL